MTTSRRGRESVLGYFYLLIVVVAVSAAAVLGLTFYQYETESAARDDLEQYHVRTVALATEVSSRIGVAEGIVSGAGLAANSNISTDREFVSAILAVSEVIDEIAAIQAADGEEAFEQTVARAEERANSMEFAALEPSWTSTRWESELTAMDFTTFQLSRLHSTTIEDELTDLSESTDRLRLVTFVVAMIVLGGCSVLVVRLARLVRQRLRELDEANAALLEAQARLQQGRRLEALSTLVGGVAHDFNNLLAAILGYSELALASLDRDDPAFGSVRNVQGAGERAAALTRQLLAFSRQETGEPELTDLNMLLRDLEPVIRGLMPGDIELNTAHDPALRPVLVDPVQMEQVVLNLVINARDATSSGGVVSIETVLVDRVEAGDEDRPAAFTKLTVEDSGCGMSPEIVARAYEPFFTTKEASRGTGLGLSVVHGIVTSSDGFLEVESEPGVGTRFDLYLPAVTANDASTDEPRATPISSGSETVMLIEDDERIRDLLTTALEQSGYSVLTFTDGEVALAGFRRQSDEIDLVVTDVVMPGMRGPELVTQLRVIRPSIPVVFMSGYGEEGVLELVRKSGDAFVRKPFKLRDLMLVVREQIARGATAGDRPTAPPASSPQDRH